MPIKILIKRGLSANLPILQTGEPAFTTDTNKLYVGNNGTNVLINNESTTVTNSVCSLSIQTATPVHDNSNLTITEVKNICGTSFIRYDNTNKKIYVTKGIYRIRIDMNVNSLNNTVNINLNENTENVCSFKDSDATTIKKICGEFFIKIDSNETEISFTNASGAEITINNNQSPNPIYIQKIN